jgi:hypothetical protein
MAAAAQAEARDFQAAQETAAAISEESEKAGALTAIAEAYLRAGDPTAAARTLQAALQSARAIPLFLGENRQPSYHQPATLSAIAGVQAEAGTLAEARKLAQEIRKAPWQDVAWRNIVTAQARQGNLGAAQETAEHIRDNEFKGEALKDVVVGLIRTNDLTAARQVVDTIHSSMWRGQALLEVAKAQVRANWPEAAAATFGKILRDGQELKDNQRFGNVRPALLSNLAQAQAAVGEEDAARAWIEKQTANLDKVYALLGLAEGILERARGAGPPPIGPWREQAIPGTIRVFRSPPTPDEADVKRLLDQRARRTPTTVAAKAASREDAPFRGKIILFGCARISDPSGPRILALSPDLAKLETILDLKEDQSIAAGRVTPDGRRLAFSVRQGRGERATIWVLEANGHTRKLADGMVEAWSPDGKRLACRRGERGSWESFLLDVDNGREERLPLPKTDLVNDWSPDGRRLAVSAGNPDQTFEHPTKGTYPLRKIYLVNTDGSGREELKADRLLDILWPRFAPDGKRLTYHQRRHQDGRVFHAAVVYTLDGGTAKEILSFDTFYKGNKEYRANGFPCWSPAGEQVIWLVPRQRTEWATLKMELLFVSPATRTAKRLDLYEKGLRFVTAVDWR